MRSCGNDPTVQSCSSLGARALQRDIVTLVAHRNRRLFDCGQLTLREERYLIVAFTVMTDVPEVVGP